jgi:hypothetical protein
MNILSFLAELLYSGLGNLASYLAAHVLFCLLLAFRSLPGFSAGELLCTIILPFAETYKGSEYYPSIG